MKKFLGKFLLVNPHAAEDEQEIRYKVVYLNCVFAFAAIVAFGMGFVRWRASALVGMIDFGFSGVATVLLFYLYHHQQKVEFVSSIALTLSFILFFTIFLLAPYNTVRASLFFLLLASAFFLKGRNIGLYWLIFLLLSIVFGPLVLHIDTAYSLIDLSTLCLYLIALFFIFDRFEAVKEEQSAHLNRLNMTLDGKMQELVKAQEELVRKEKLAVLGQIAGSVGHELRNPLGVMSNAVYFLQTVLSDADDTTKEYLNIIKDEIAGSERIVSDLLDSVRTNPPQPEMVALAELMQQSLRKCSVPSSVVVKLDIPATLAPLRVDPLQIHQVFRNLISNGIEAMPEGGVLEISAVENAQTRTIHISVKDNGIGIAPEVLDKLFQPLFTTKARGIGLGLVVVKNFTEANCGTVAVQSEDGNGTTFTVTLPATNSSVEGAQ